MLKIKVLPESRRSGGDGVNFGIGMNGVNHLYRGSQSGSCAIEPSERDESLPRQSMLKDSSET